MSESVPNYYSKVPAKFLKKYHNPEFKKHGIKIPFKAVCLGPTGSGKTNMLTDILHKMKGTFNRIVICVKSKAEPLYDYIAEKSKNQIEFFEGGTIPEISSFNDSGQSLVVFDDLVLENPQIQSKIAEYYIRGRKVGDGISCIYLSQSYYKTPKVIRINSNYFFIKKLQNLRDLRMILSEFGLDKNVDEITQLYKLATHSKFDFLMIDTDAEDDSMKFRHNYKPFANVRWE